MGVVLTPKDNPTELRTRRRPGLDSWGFTVVLGDLGGYIKVYDGKSTTRETSHTHRRVTVSTNRRS